LSGFTQQDHCHPVRPVFLPRIASAIKGTDKVHLVSFGYLHQRKNIDGAEVGLPGRARLLDPLGDACGDIPEMM
jgi:hypothetical protein